MTNQPLGAPVVYDVLHQVNMNARRTLTTSKRRSPWVIALFMCAGCAPNDNATASSQVATENTSEGSRDEASSPSSMTTVPTPLSPSSASTGTSAAPEPAVTPPMSGGVSLHFAASEDCAFQDSWVDFPQGATRTVTETERGALAQQGRGVVSVTCEYIDRSPAKFFFMLNTPEGGTSRTVSLAPELSRHTELYHALRVTIGDAEARPTEEHMCAFSVLDMAENLSWVWGKVSCPKLVRDDLTGDCHLDEGYFYFEGCRPRD